MAEPIIFEPIPMERVWGGRRLESLYGKHLPQGAPMVGGRAWAAESRLSTGPLIKVPWQGPSGPGTHTPATPCASAIGAAMRRC